MEKNEIINLFKTTGLRESEYVLQLISSGMKIHDYYYCAWDEMTSKDKVDEYLTGAQKHLETQENDRGKEIARKISEFLDRKCSGETIVCYLSLVLENSMSFEFWQLKNGWIGWRGHDYEYIQEDNFLKEMFDDLENL